MSRAVVSTALVAGVCLILVAITWLVFDPPLWRALGSMAVGAAVAAFVLWRRRERAP